MTASPPRSPSSPRCGEAAGPAPRRGGAGAATPWDQRTAEMRAAQVTEFRARRACGDTPALAAAEMGMALTVLEGFERRFEAGGIKALRPRRPRPAAVLDPVDFRKLGRRPRSGPEHFKWQSFWRVFTLGRILQLKAGGAGYPTIARRIGCGVATAHRLHQLFKKGGLLALTVKPSPGRPRKAVAA